MRFVRKHAHRVLLVAVTGLATQVAFAEHIGSAEKNADGVLESHYHHFFLALNDESALPKTKATAVGERRPRSDVDRLALDEQYREFFASIGYGGNSKRTSSSMVGESTPKPKGESTVVAQSVDGDILESIRAGFGLPELDVPLVRHYETWFARQPQYLNRVLARGAEYLPYIVNQVTARGLPTEVALLPTIESAFNPFARSRANAVGLWQFIEPTARRFDLRIDFWFDGRRDIVDATDAALDYLEFLNEDMQGDWFHTFAAYNTGEHKLQKEIRRNTRAGKPTDFSALTLYRETRHYVPKLVALRNIIRHPERFSLELARISSEQKFTKVSIDYPIDLGIAAALAKVSQNELRRLNPGFLRRTTGERGTTRLLLPTASAEAFTSALQSRSAKSLLASSSYRVHQGDNLNKIARRNGVSINSLRRANRLKGDLIRVGQVLTVPTRSQKYSAIFVDGIDVFNSASGGAKAKAKRPKRITHHVRSGDTLSAIARRYRVYANQIAKWNSISQKDIIRRGQKLIIFR